MSRQPQVIRQCDCNPGVSLLCVLGEQHLPKGKEYLSLSLPLVSRQSMIIYSVADV